MRLDAIPRTGRGRNGWRSFAALWRGYRALFEPAVADPPLAARRAPSPRKCPTRALYESLSEAARDDPVAHCPSSRLAPPPIVAGCSVAVSP